MDEQEIYEPPAIVEVGAFSDLTRGFSPGDVFDWPPQPFEFYSPEGG